MQKGIVFNIQKYSVNDGPGIRTTIFLKGCPLNCLWCHNPESQRTQRDIFFIANRCLGCGKCIEACGTGALSSKEEKIIFDKKLCQNCGNCTKACRPKARHFVGDEMTVEEVMKEIMKDYIFYDESGGGATFSGGEPLVQSDFLLQLLERCKEEGIHTTIDTCGFASWDILEKVADNVDLILYDIKHMDNDKHIKYMGTPNELILDNLKKLSERRKRIFVRMPIIPGINDDEENLKKAAEFITKLNVEQVNLLPYHGIAKDKYNRLSRDYELLEVKDPTKDDMSKVLEVLQSFGLNCKIGG